MSRESLTESMRRYANIVTEAEQLNENWLRWIGRLLAGGTELGDVGKVGGQVSTRLQLSDIDRAAKHFKMALGTDPDKWDKVADIYFDQFKSSEFAKLHADRRGNFKPTQTIDRFEKNFKQLIDAAARVARDPNDVNTKQWSKLSLQVLSQMRNSASGDTREYLNKLFKELLAAEADVTNVRWAVGWLAGLMAAFPALYAATHGLDAAADHYERKKSAPDPSADTGVDDIPMSKSRSDLEN